MITDKKSAQKCNKIRKKAEKKTVLIIYLILSLLYRIISSN